MRFGLAASALIAAGPLSAQIPTPTIDTTAADSQRVDSLRQDATRRYLAAESLSVRSLATLPDLGADGPRAAGSRVVLDRRAIAWRTAESVADLLAEVPGVYVWRGGWFGRPMYANFRGRGATGISWYLDGVPWTPLGPDSVGVDPARFSLALLERVEIERWPGELRVHLYTPQYARRAPRSRIGIATGEFKITRYQGDLEYRWSSGMGLTVATEYFDAPAPTNVRGDARLTSTLIRTQWVPRPDRGVQLQYYTQAPALDPYVGLTGDTLGARLRGTQSDLQARAFL
ncbi:MAG TPA: Plug domain-containing protein, partial [Gemmatimonadales bacterium]|nr:Plug domain-containing protein [Gemmatimonadales bacterium]